MAEILSCWIFGSRHHDFRGDGIVAATRTVDDRQPEFLVGIRLDAAKQKTRANTDADKRQYASLYIHNIPRHARYPLFLSSKTFSVDEGEKTPIAERFA